MYSPQRRHPRSTTRSRDPLVQRYLRAAAVYTPRDRSADTGAVAVLVRWPAGNGVAAHKRNSHMYLTHRGRESAPRFRIRRERRCRRLRQATLSSNSTQPPANIMAPWATGPDARVTVGAALAWCEWKTWRASRDAPPVDGIDPRQVRDGEAASCSAVHGRGLLVARAHCAAWLTEPSRASPVFSGGAVRSGAVAAQMMADYAESLASPPPTSFPKTSRGRRWRTSPTRYRCWPTPRRSRSRRTPFTPVAPGASCTTSRLN